MTEIQQKRLEVEDKNYRLSNKEILSYTQFHQSYFLENHKHILDLDHQNTKVWLQDGMYLLNGFSRIVIGAHGAYIEFVRNNLETRLVVPESQEWRIGSRFKIKYEWFTPVDSSVKIYRQVRKVKYADYIAGRYYVDFYSTRI
jgi:hypothetical protein